MAIKLLFIISLLTSFAYSESEVLSDSLLAVISDSKAPILISSLPLVNTNPMAAFILTSVPLLLLKKDIYCINHFKHVPDYILCKIPD